MKAINCVWWSSFVVKAFVTTYCKEYGVVFTVSIEYEQLQICCMACMIYSYINRRLYAVTVSFMSCMLWFLVTLKIWIHSLLLSHICCCSLVVWITSWILLWYVNIGNDLILVICATKRCRLIYMRLFTLYT